MDFRVFFVEGITGNIRWNSLPKERGQKERERGQRQRLGQHLNQGAGRRPRVRSRIARAEPCSGSCGGGGFSQEMKEQH